MSPSRFSSRVIVISPAHVLAQLRRSLARRGVGGTLWLLGWHVAAPTRAAFRAVVERRFDARHGVDTRGTVRMHDSSLNADAVKYAAVNPRHFRALTASLPADPGSLTFLDIGCGKGRTFVLAAEAGFGKLVGVELSHELATIARMNLAACGSRGEVVEGDAARFAFPDEPLFVFLFNPFGEATLQAVLEKLRRSYSDYRRPVFLAYENPIHRDRVAEAGFLSLVAEGRHWALFGAT